ncbi:translation initiation factor IF-2 [Siniperca chuatsi]|uniref:translation initiation factor IF-2 n=1 Tax=Siniperca chuatsi TaxID=119488 RepID=UPI001CE22095|nr:translation initiation factor IF-2 [Siniperca chuatsi]
MPATKVIMPKPVEATRKTLEKPKPVKVRAVNGAENDLRVPAVRKSRASSCPRCPQRDPCARSTGAQRAALKTSCERRSRSTSTAPKTTARTTNPDYRRATNSVKHPECREMSGCPGPRAQLGVRAEAKHASQSHKAFTVIPPNPKKRREIQRKAEAELAALEELRLSRAMAYVSINPSSVGGCMSLEEVRLKQQQEMMQAKRKPMKTQVMEQTPVLNS